MKQNVDIHVVLATPADMDDYHEDAHDAADRINFILHAVYDGADEDVETEWLERLLHHTWEIWHQNSNLLDIDDDELLDWVDHTLATWDDADNEEFY
ncbi:hypothetical protein CA267_018520 [Alteromonas pelagimontana]|uniref:Uncharacterized protein n=1 Tax=Alteromonas pelagimontana TaxID=1858656 RepID=A0A6M4MHW4_9ALTE|nr:hypothetical protein [Alteromonas pelagimontana]QJR82602.1 hypothetical protein CA267_018520 [Alteromonas pelagimontana]